MKEKEKTFGEKRVRVSFNPSDNSEVDEVKKEFAALIDKAEKFKEKDPRMASIIQTKLEEGSMWFVKLLTV